MIFHAKVMNKKADLQKQITKNIITLNITANITESFQIHSSNNYEICMKIDI